MTWIVEYLNAQVVEEGEALPIGMRGRLSRITELIQVHGLERVHEPHVKHLEGQLWEMRLKRPHGHCARDLCHGHREAGGDRAGLPEEDPATGNRVSP